MAGYFNRRIINFTIFISVIFVVVQFFSCHNISAAPCSSGWVLQNRVPTSETLKKITFVDSHNGYITGENGVVVNSTDGGKSWNLRKDLSVFERDGIAFAHNEMYFSIRQDGKIYRTDNGGLTWQVVYENEAYIFNEIVSLKKCLLVFGNETQDKTKEFSENKNGDKFVVLISKDNGITWDELLPFKEDGALYVYTAKPDSMVIRYKNDITEKEKLIFTLDGGINWKTRELSLNLPYFNGVFFLNDKQAWAITDSALYITTDGGFNWKLGKSQYLSDMGIKAKDIFFLNPSLGFIAGRNRDGGAVLLKTGDGGKSWKEILSCEQLYCFNRVYFKPNGEGWILGSSGAVFYTVNYGRTWLNQTEGCSDMIGDVHFINGKKGIAITGVFYKSFLEGGVLLTENGGKSWRMILHSFNLLPGSITVLNDKNIMISGTILDDSDKSADLTEYCINDWNGLVSNLKNNHRPELKRIWNFLSRESQNIIISSNAGSSSGESEKQVILKDLNKIINAGDFYTKKSFSTITLNSEARQLCSKGIKHLKLREIKRLNRILLNLSLKNILSNQRKMDYNTGLFIHSNDGGKTWKIRKIGNMRYITDMISDSLRKKIWAMGIEKNSNLSALLCSADFGKTWKKIRNFPLKYQKLCFVDDKTYFVYGSEILYKTNDGGKTWEDKTVTIGKTEPLAITEMFFLNNSKGWMIGKDRTAEYGSEYLFETFDAGETWKLKANLPVIEFVYYHSIFFVNDQIGWIVGSEGIILKTTDGGKTWKQQSSGTANNLNKIFFIDEKTGWIVGDNGTILFTETGGE